MRRYIWFVLIALSALWITAALLYPWMWLGGAIVLPLLIWAAIDTFQNSDNVRRNFPVLGSVNVFLTKQRHVPQEVALLSSTEGRPFDRIQIRLVKKRAENAGMHEPFGTEYEYNTPGREWFAHSLYPGDKENPDTRVTIGGPACVHPYSASVLNVGAMSFGSISANATRALCRGAALGGFAVNTGEGGLTDHHLEPGCDLIWQIGTGYFGCRTNEGRFDPDIFAEKAAQERVRMIEIKISQGAKPGFGAILPASKNTEEIAGYRGIEPHTEVRSPPGHAEFHDHEGLLRFVDRLRSLSGAKPVGIKACLGQREEWLELIERMAALKIVPDFISIDAGDGGTGAADLDSIHYVGMPGNEALGFLHSSLVDAGIREQTRLIMNGKVTNSFDIARYLAKGADACFASRAFMLSLGCVQSLKCDSNHCPTGITTMNPRLTRGLVVSDKAARVRNFHENTVLGLCHLLGAAGVDALSNLQESHIQRVQAPQDREARGASVSISTKGNFL